MGIYSVGNLLATLKSGSNNLDNFLNTCPCGDVGFGYVLAQAPADPYLRLN
jgi:hypothetical protein